MGIIVWRIYEKPIPEEYRILVDGLWPRGIEKGNIDYWAKEFAPSAELRKWFSHDPDKWDIFIRMYREELEKKPNLKDFIEILRERLGNGEIIFLYASRERFFNNAVALKKIIEEIMLSH
ncbi:MAG: DUF488 family protein [Thermoplasmata archaeon]